MIFPGAYSYGRYVYFISYYLSTHRTEFGAAVALQATLGASASLAMAYLSYGLLEKRFLRLKRLCETAKEAVPQRLAAGGPPDRRSRQVC